MRAAVIEAIDELIQLLAAFQEKLGREVELSLQTDGTAWLMVAEEFTLSNERSSGFEELAHFDGFQQLVAYLEAGPEAARL
jgi:hypothetical protein